MVAKFHQNHHSFMDNILVSFFLDTLYLFTEKTCQMTLIATLKVSVFLLMKTRPYLTNMLC